MTNRTIVLRPRRDSEVAQEPTDDHSRPPRQAPFTKRVMICEGRPAQPAEEVDFHKRAAHVPYGGVGEHGTKSDTATVSSGVIRPMLISAHDAARFLGIGRTTLYQLIKTGDVTPVHIGRCVRFSMYELEAYVEHLMGVAPPPPQPAERPHASPRRRAPRNAVSAPTLF